MKTEIQNLSARETAAAYAKARTKADKAAILAYVEGRVATSKRVRWAKLLEDITKGDAMRVTARATGDWSAVNAAREDAPAKPKAAAKAKAKPVAKARKAPAKAKPQAIDVNAMVASIAAMDEVQMAAFFDALTKARA